MPRASSRKAEHVGVYVQLPRKMHERAKALAKNMRRSLDAEMVEALARHLAQPPQPQPPMPTKEPHDA